MPTISITDYLGRLFKEADKLAVDAAQEAGATCRKGCNHCCMFLATITLADGFYMAEGLMHRGDWEEWLPKLAKASKDFCFEGLSREAFFRKRIPCVFLKDGMCSQYERRPAACRYHYVISDPELCSPDQPEDINIARLDFMKLESQTSWQVSMQMHDFPLSGPIPLMVLHCIDLMTQSENWSKWNDRNEAVKKVIKEFDVPTPLEWMRTHAKELLKIGDSETANFLANGGDLDSIIPSKR